MIKKGLSFLLVLALFFSLLPAAAMGAEASEGTYYSYEDIVERTYDLSYLAKDPLPGEGGKQITSTDPASQYNEETGLYENWSANLDNSGYVRYEDGWRVIADLEGPGYMTRFWIPTLWHGTMQLFIDGELIYEGSTADFIWGSCFSEYSELSFQANYHDTEQFGPGYLGGIDLFVPITYNESLKLRLDVNEGNAMYYNLSYYELEDGASVESFTWPMSEETKAILKGANDILLNETAPVGGTTFAATVGAGETVTLFESATPGALTSMAMDIDIPTEEFDDRTSLVDWVISMYWDGAAEPAVCLPVADFFGIHYGKTAFDSAAYGLEEDGTAYCRWYMPFNSARITLTNQSDSARAVSCSLGSEALTTADDLNRFHANWQRSYARNDDRYPEAQLLSITGEGRYVGTSLHIYQIIDGIWWGEGDEKFYIDGEKYPTWFGTGSEDYFCYAWCGSMLFDYPYCGQPHNDGYPATGEKQVQGHGDKVNYRQHITDNIVFYESFEANIEKYFNETVDKYAATTYFYLTAATTGNHVAAAPAREDRLFNNDVLTAPTLFYPGAYISSRVIDSNTSVVPWLQPADQFTATEGEWFGGLNYMWNISAKGKYINYLLDIPEGGSYDMNVSMTVAPDYGIFEFYLDDVLIGTVDTFHSSVDLKTVKLGTVELTPGAHELQIRCAGKSLSSAGYIMGLNYIELVEADGKPVDPPAYEYFFGGYDDLYAALDSSDFNVVTQGTGDFTNYTWHGNAHILWAGAESGSTNFKINIPTADTYTMTLSRTLAGDFGIFDIAIDGTVVAQNVDSFRPGGVFGEVSKYYSIDLTAGEHTLSFISKGKNAASAGYLIGIDYVQFNTQTDFGAFYGAYNQLLSLADEDTTAALSTQDLGWVALNKWYHNTQLWWNDRGTASFTVTLPEDGYYDITTQYTMAGDYGKFDLLIDGKKIGQTVDAYGALDLGINVNKDIYLTGGDHTLAIVSAGKNDASGGYIIGLSSIDFLGDTDVPEKENYSYFFGGYDDLFPLVDSANSDYAPVTQGLTSNYYTFHDNAHMLWAGGESGKVDFVVNIPTTDTYTMTLSRTLAGDFGIFDIAIDGTIVAQNVDSFQSGGVFGEVSKYYFIDLTEGEHTISFISKGKNAASAGYLIGIDYVQFDTQTNFGAFYGGFNDLLAAADENNSAALSVQDLGWVAVNVWHHNNQLMWNDQNTASFTIELPADGYYDITTEYTMAGDYGMFELAIDGNKIGETVDAYGALGLGTVTTADVYLTKGSHTLTISCAGKNEASSGYNIGISSIDFLGDTEAPATEEPGESLSKIQRAAYEALRSYAENALAQADSLQKPHIHRAMADGMIAIAAAADDEVAALLAEAKAAIDTVLATTYEEELEIDLLDDLFYEGAEMPKKVSSYTSNVEPHGQGMGAAWSGSGHMFWPANENGEMCVTIHVPYAATYTGSFAYTLAGDFGIYDVYLDDIKILEGIDSYAATISVKSVDFGEISMTEGDHVLKIVITGKNSASANYYMAIDHLILSGINEVIQYRASACKYLDSYKLEEDYSPEQWQVLQAVIAEQKAIINGCATVDDVIAAWKNAKTVINAIDTGLVDYENITFDAAKTPADFGWSSDDDNFTNWQTTADGRTFFIFYPGSDSQRIWKDLITDPDNFTLTAEIKVGEKRAYMELFGVTIELNCENGNGNQIFDKENWAWFDAEDQICFVTISRVEGGDLNITLSGKGNATEVCYTKPVADDTNTNFFFGLWDAGASAYISDIAVTGVEAQTVDNFGWDTDEIGGSKDFSGWTSLDGTDITAVYTDTTGNHRIWKGLVEDQNNFTVYADITALTESSAYIKLLGQTLELDARNGNGAQLGVKLNGTFRDWIAAEGLNAQVYLTRVDGGDIAVTIVTNGKTTKAEFTLTPSESSENVELGIYAGTVTFADLAVTEPETDVEVLKNPGDFGWESDSEDFSGWTATDEANLSVTYDQTVNGRVWKGLLSDLNNFTIDLDVTNDNTSSTYIKVLGVTVELDSNNGDGNQTFMKVGGVNYDWLSGNGCKFHVTISRENGGDLNVTVTGEGNETAFTATATPAENNENVELGLYRGISKFENITVASGEAEPTEVEVKISHTVSFDSDLQMNYRIKLADILAAVPKYVTDGAYLTVEKDRYPMGGGEKTVETVTLYPDLTTDAERMLFNLAGIQSVEMGSELRAVLHFFDANGNEYYTTVDTYSVLAYAELCFDYYDPATDGYLFTMLIDCLNYGSAAQVAFDRRADELVNAGLEAYQQYATTELSAELSDVRTYVDNDRSITAVTKMGFSVTFSDKTEINAKLTIAEGYTKADITSVKVLNENGEEVATLTEFTELDDGRFQATFTGVKSVNMRDMYYFVAYVGDQVASQNVGYSIEAYAKSNIGSSDAALSALVRNCIYYGDSAKIYFDSLIK